MIRKVLSIVLYVVAGFFLYIVSLVAFIDGAALGVDGAGSGAKWLPVVIFTVPAILALGAGLAIARFQDWMRDTGIVLLCAAGFTTFLILTFASLLMNEDYRRMMPPEALTVFGDYITGSAVIAALAVAGVLLVLTGRRRPRTIA